MKPLLLGRTDLSVSEICLGTMTWGNRNSEAEGHAQIDMALDHGVNFVDTAEMYPTNPVAAETIGRSEEVIGSWLASTGRRDALVVATKITGAGQPSVRDGAPITAAALLKAVEASLGRLQTDVIDLYQIHWPNRGSYHFRRNWTYDPSGQRRGETEAHLVAVLETVQALIEAGKLRHFAVSNETAWGTALWLELAERHGLPRVQTIQNEYSLLCRTFDTDLAELAVNEDVTLLGYSPLATGLLTGKYQDDRTPPNSRRSLTPALGGRVAPRVWPAIDAYLGIAARHGLDPSQMALAWFRTRPFPAIPIIGATDLAQLGLALGSAYVTLSSAVVSEINEVHGAHPMPF